MTTMKDKIVVWQATPLIWASILGATILFSFSFYEGFKELTRVWGEKEEYSYGYLIPFITLFLIWQKKDSLERVSFSGSWIGVLAVLFGLGLFIVGDLSTLYLIVQYASLVVLMGLVLSYTGWEGFRIIWIPLLFLLFMIPLPQFFLQEISAQLQLISSGIGVGIIRQFGISVFLEGNVIDLGAFKLQVVEACSGLRYLFPLMTLAFISAYFYQGKFWKRAVIFLSSIPITILMNSFRIGVIGVAVEYWGRAMAEGFLHDFEGWAVFMACTAVLVAEMWILSRIGNDVRPLKEIFGVEFPAPTPKDAKVQHRALPKPYMVGLALMILVATVSAVLPHRIEATPTRQILATFPLQIDGWKGLRETMESYYLNELKLDDYILANYGDGAHSPVNLYVAYYASQKKHQSTHSPRTCIPGGGWKITSFTARQIPDIQVGDALLNVNRVVIQKGEYKQLVYYWFQQRGRILTNEYFVKWFIFWDALTRNRTDGALVRLTTTISPGEDIAEADHRLTAFAKLLNEPLKNYLPN